MYAKLHNNWAENLLEQVLWINDSKFECTEVRREVQQ